MSERILVIKNTRWVRPGLLDSIIDAHGVGTETIELDGGELVPDVRPYPAVIVLGGVASANDGGDMMRHQLARLTQALEHDVPVLGSCLGMQILAKAAGGTIRRAQEMEAGFFNSRGEPFEVELTDEGRHDPVLSGLPDRFRVFQSHGEEVQLGGDIDLLARGTIGTVNQLVRAGRCAYGLQMHMEVIPNLLAEWTEVDDHFANMDPIGLQNDLEVFGGDMARNFRTIATNFFMMAGLVTPRIDLVAEALSLQGNLDRPALEVDVL